MEASKAAWGAELKRRRLSARLNQTALAKRVGVSRATIIAWEAGTQTPSDVSREMLEEALPTPSAGVVRESSPAYRGREPASFPEHVLFIAGQIVQLGRQIESAAKEQVGLGNDLGRRAEATAAAEPVSPQESAALVRAGRAPKASPPVAQAARRKRG